MVEEGGKRDPGLDFSEHSTKAEAACSPLDHQCRKAFLRLISVANCFDLASVVV